MKKKEIILELNKLLENNNFIHDIWLYGSLDDNISDLDLIVLYNSKPKKIILSKHLTNMVADGTVIYVQSKVAKDIFLFEDLKIYSIKKKKKINNILSKDEQKLRSLTSFLERYYERRIRLLKIRSITAESLRIIKSIIFSYQNFYFFCKIEKIFPKNYLHFKKYKLIRKKFSNKKLNKKTMIKYLEEFKKNDELFYLKSIDILNRLFDPKKNYYLDYTFNEYTKYSFIKNKSSIVVPYILGYIYKFYSSLNLSISKKIKLDFKSNIRIIKKNKLINSFLKKKINFLNQSYKSLKKAKFKTGLYRMTWYLVD
jgi:hypothetical protein